MISRKAIKNIINFAQLTKVRGLIKTSVHENKKLHLYTCLNILRAIRGQNCKNNETARKLFFVFFVFFVFFGIYITAESVCWQIVQFC